MNKIASIYRVWLLLGMLFSASTAGAQRIGDLNGIYYQAVALDDETRQIAGSDIVSKPLYEKEIGVRFTITKGVNGQVQWQETHTTKTDKYGLFSLIIGKGVVTGSQAYARLLDIPWIDADQWLKVEIATKNNGSYKTVSYQQFMSVPYAFYTDDIADDAITSEKILDSAILNRDIRTSSVDSRTILDSTVTNQDVETMAIDTRTLLDSTVLNRDIATGAVDSRTLLDSAVINEDLRTASVDSRVILDSTLLNEDIRSGSVDSRTILNFSLINEDLASDAVDSRIISDQSVQNEDILDGTIDITRKVSGVLPAENGGTGVDSLVNHGILLGGGNNPVRAMKPGGNGQIPVGQTNADPVMKVLAGGRGIKITETPDSVILDYTLSGKINADGIQQITIGQIAPGTTFISSAFPVPGSGSGQMGDIVLASLDKNLQGCILSAYFFSTNTIKVAIFNGTGNNVNLGTANVKLLIVQ